MILNINGTLHHLEAIGVIDDEGEQHARNDAFAEALSALYQFGGDGVFDTTVIRNADYIIAVTPFQ